MAVGFVDKVNSHVPSRDEMRNKFHSVKDGTSRSNWGLLAAWSLSSILAVIVPVSKWAMERNRYYKYYGAYNEYEQQQQQYEGQNNGGNNWNGNYYNVCSWWNLACKYRMRRYQQNYGGDGGGGNNEQAQMQAILPNWYYFFGGSVEEDERQREEMGMGQNEGGMKFVYICTLVMFVVLATFGFRQLYAGKEKTGTILALFIFGMFSLMNLLTTVQGTIETDGRFFEESVYGWYGQWAVLVAYTDFWLMLHCFIFAGVLGIMRFKDKRAKHDADEESALELGYRQEEDTEIA
mgnify:CR=1 FL=1